MMKWLVLTLCLTFLALFLIFPVAVNVWMGVQWVALREVVLNPVYREGLFNAASIAVVTTALAALIAVPLAWWSSRFHFRGKALAESALLVPLIMPPFVGALGVFQLFGQYGAVNALGSAWGWWPSDQGPDWLGPHRFAATCMLEALHFYPILYLTTATALARLDPALLEAAAALGASPWTRFQRVVLPLVRPGLFAGGIIVAVSAFTEVGTPLMMGLERVLPVQILWGLLEIQSNPVPFALTVEMLIVAGGGYLIAQRLFANRTDAMVIKQANLAQIRNLHGWPLVGVWAAFIGVVLLAALPHAGVVLMAVAREWYGTTLPTSYALDHVRAALSHELVVPGVINSLSYAGMATVLALAVGTFIAWTCQRWKPRGWQALDVIAMLPLAVPGIVLAFGLFSMAMGIPWLRVWLDPIRNPTLLLVIAYAIRRLPQVVRASTAGFQQLPVAYEEAAAALGAGPLYRLRRIIVPLLMGSLVAGAVLTFSFSMLEVADSLIMAQKREFFPVARVIYELVNILGPGPSIACAFAVWAMLFLASMLALASAVLGKRLGDLLRE